MKIKFSTLILSLIIGAISISCSKDNETTDNSNKPVVTEKGEPKGNAVSVSIGSEGGMLTSEDGHLTVTIPQGAFLSGTTVSIQPLTNNAPLGLGNAYRIEAGGATLNKAATLTFHFDPQLIGETPSDFLWITTQADDGTWGAMIRSEVNPADHTVSVETTHFSDWALGRFIDLALHPSSATLRRGQSVQLMVSGFSRDKEMPEDEELVPLVPLNSDDDELVPLTPIPGSEEILMDFKVKEWSLNGSVAPVSGANGSLNGSGNMATYTAPSESPSVNPVAVSVRLEAKDKAGVNKIFILSSVITIVEADYYLIVKSDGVSYDYYQYGFNGTVPPDPDHLKMVNCGILDGKTLQIAAGEFTGNGESLNNFILNLENVAETSRNLVSYHQDGDDDMAFSPNLMSSYQQTLAYTDREYDPAGDKCTYSYKTAEVTVTIIRYSYADHYVTGYFSGVLYEDKQEYSGQCKDPDKHTIEGEFNLYPVY